jgi:hypothetical protein
MLRSKLAARTVPVETALRCLDRVSEAQGLTATGMDELDLPNVISVDELIGLARKRGIKIRPKAIRWSRLLSETAFTDILLRLNNGNMVLALRNNKSNPTQVVASDPLYEDGKPFHLPADALSKVWAGEALIVEPRHHARVKRSESRVRVDRSAGVNRSVANSYTRQLNRQVLEGLGSTHP